ncbi:L-lysine 6-transaminase [Candidatus Kapabacteria bacterium]|nr:L-lysine 6-transaminase [Candidatus Kapabacteria bacterium]
MKQNSSIQNDIHNSLKNHILADGMPISLDLEKSNGCYIHDRKSGKDYLDLFTCFASMPIGFNHPKINNSKFINKIGKVALNKPSNSDLYTEEFASFVEAFFDKAVPSQFKYGFFISGGALAVENALKAAFDWKVRKNLQLGIKDKDQKVIYFNEAFHGRSGYTMTITNTSPDKVMYFPKFDWIKVDNPKIKFPVHLNLEDLVIREKNTIAQIKKAFIDNPDEIAAIILEPIQGEGGDNHFRPDFLQKLKSLAIENNSLLIFDEVQTGLGITGSWWAHEQLGVQPDILAFGKKMQTCGIIAGSRLDEVEDNVFHKSSRINSTWGGNLVDMVRAEAYINIIEEEKMLSNVLERGDDILIGMHKVAEKHSDIVTNIRGRGLFSAFDINPKHRNKFLENTFSNGLIILPCGHNSIRFRPPLNVTKDEINLGIDIIEKSISQL